MPAFRNLKTRRSSGRICHQIPVMYAKDGWQQLPATLGYSHNDIGSPHTTATSPSTTAIDSDFEIPLARKNKVKPSKSSCPSNDSYIPRPKNAFIFFRSHFYKTEGGNDQNQISVAAGKAWKALSQAGKEPFLDLAKKEKAEHQAKFPGYTYAPGSKSSAAKRKTTTKKKSRPSIKKVLIPQPNSVPVSRPVIQPTSYSFPPPESFNPTVESPSPTVSGVEDPMVEVANDEDFDDEDSTSDPEGLFTPGWSFVPTSEIPTLELSPVKLEKDTQDELMLLRPPSYDFIDEPFQPKLKPVTVEGFLAGSPLPVLHYDYLAIEGLYPCTPFTSSTSLGWAGGISSGPSQEPFGLTSFGGSTYSKTLNEVNSSTLGTDMDTGDDLYASPPHTPDTEEVDMEKYINFFDDED